MEEMEYKTPFADKLPPLSTEERAALEADLKLRGQLDPIYADEDGNILDGHNRLDLLPDPWVEIIDNFSSWEEKEAFVLSRNMKRRNLSPDQKREVRRSMQATAKKLRETDPKKWTQERLAQTFGVDRTTVTKWESDWDMHNVNVHIVQQAPQKPDSRVKLSTEAKAEAVARVKAGESQAQVAADFGVDRATVSRAVKAEQKKRQRTAIANDAPPLPDGVFDLILADPPWKYDFSETDQRKIENHYPTMASDAIADIELPAADNCVLFMWATAPKLKEAFEVLEGWGFTYKTHAVWDKQKIGMGYWFRGQHEVLMVATRGNVSPPPEGVRVSSVFSCARGQHSVKPIQVYEAIEAMFPAATKCEMFARIARPGWTAWGNQV